MKSEYSQLDSANAKKMVLEVIDHMMKDKENDVKDELVVAHRRF